VTKSALAIAAALTLAAPLAYAQNMNQPPAAPAKPHATQSSFTTQTGDLRASKLIGSTVYDVQNENIGSVKDLVLDKTGKVTGVIVDVGAFLGMGGKYVAVGLNDIKMDNDRLTLDRSKDQLKQEPAYQLTNQS
jgi:sporulation protein YlmC with PRC-barrel domain